MTRILIILAMLALPAFADKTSDARKYFDAGRQAYEAGQYTVAISAFEEAYRLAPRSSIVFALGQAYRRQYSVDRDDTKLLRAGTLYRQYLEEVKQGERREEATRYLGEIEPLLARIEATRKSAPPPVAPVATQIMISSQTKGARGAIDGGALSEIPVIADVKPGVHKVRVEAPGYFTAEADSTAVDGRLIVAELTLVEKPAQLSVKGPDGSTISVDGRTAGTTPLAKPIALPAGKHFVAVTKRGHNAWSREVTLERGQASSIDASLARTNQRRISYGLFVGVGALALAGGVTTLLGLSARGDANDIKAKIDAGTASRADLDEYNRKAESANDRATISRFTFAVAGAVAITALLLYYVDSPRVESQNTVTPTVTAGGAGAVWTRTF